MFSGEDARLLEGDRQTRRSARARSTRWVSPVSIGSGKDWADLPGGSGGELFGQDRLALLKLDKKKGGKGRSSD